MQFCTSTQAKSWIFSLETLAECKRRALLFDLKRDKRKSKSSISHVRKFASGFHNSREEIKTNPDLIAPSNLSLHEQEVMIQFHAHQIQFLIGPNAILCDLRTSEKVLSTAIIYFRRFYLSNSIIEISPRKIAAASAFFAAKAEEEKVEIGLISHATALVQQRVHNAPLCCKELRAVPVIEIEYAERLLIEGLNYEFQCYHAAEIIDQIFTRDANTYTSHRMFNESNDGCGVSPRSTATSYGCTSSAYRYVEYHDGERLRRDAIDIAQRAHIFSDVHFLYAPCDIAFAITAIVTGSYSNDTYCIGSKLIAQYNNMYPVNAGDDTVFSTIRDVMLNLLSCACMDLCSIYNHGTRYAATERAEHLRHIMGEVATIRLLRKMKRNERIKSAIPSTLLNVRQNGNGTKRSRSSSADNENNAIQYQSSKRTRIHFDVDFTPPRLIRKFVRITPTTTGYYYHDNRHDIFH